MQEKWNGKNRRNAWRRLRLKYKMPILVGVPTLVLMIIVSISSFIAARTALDEQRDIAFQHLLDTKTAQLVDWLNNVQTDLELMAASNSTRESVIAFTEAWNALETDQPSTLQRLYIEDNPNPNGEKDALYDAKDGSTWSAAHAHFHGDFHNLQKARGYYDIFLFDRDGNLIYSVFKELDFATNFLNGPYKQSGLGEAYRGAANLPQGKVHSTGFEPYAPSFGAPAKFMSMPVFDEAGARIGVVALQLPVDKIVTVLAEIELLGETGEVYAVGEDGRARSGSIHEGGHEIMDELPDLPQIIAAKRGEDVFMSNVTGLSGEPVIAYTESFEHLGSNWHIVLEQDVAEAHNTSRALLSLMTIQTLVVMLVIAVLAFMIANSLTRRIFALSQSVDEIAKGNLSSIVAEAKTGDELGDIARAMTRFQSELADGKTAITDREQNAKAQQAVMDRLGNSLEKLANGALDCVLEDPFPESFEGLRHNFNKTVSELALIIEKLKSAAKLVDLDATNLNEGASQLSRRTENQAATLEETAAALDQISSGVTHAADGAQQIAKAIKAVQAQAETGERVGSQTLAAIDDIEASSKSIAAIVQLIDDIAFQTNLLALNAGVEAARAGEAGRGFSVVASEVRALSQRSSDSASQIRKLITESSVGVENGVKLANEMGQTIQDILESVAQVSDNIDSIANGAVEQASALTEINNGVNQLDRATQENAVMVEKSVSSSQALQAKAREMNDLVARFHGSPRPVGHRSPTPQAA
jgi:methyl-accepting chemotaxis protein